MTYIRIEGTTAWSVPSPTNGRTLFANANDWGRLYVRLPNGTIAALDSTFAPTSCCGPCGWWWGWACTCADVANCIDVDTTVQNSIINFLWTALPLWGLTDVDLTGLNDNDILQYDLGSNTWLPAPLPGWATDELVKISATDTTSWYLDAKVVMWSANLTKTILNPWADEDLELDLNTTLTGMVSITTQDLTVTNSATFDWATVDIINGSTLNVDWTSTTNFNGWPINYTGNTITNIWVTETYDNTSSVTFNNAVTFNVAPTGLTPTQETPAGTIDSVNLVFTLASTPTSWIIQLHVNWVYQHPTTDYWLAWTTITFAASNAPTTWSVITAYYLS